MFLLLFLFSSLIFLIFGCVIVKLITSLCYSKITEMAKESLPSPTECMYPALAGCKAPVDVILPQITSNIW